MGTRRRNKLPKYVQLSHGTYFYVRWNPAEKKVKWTKLGKTYGAMLTGLAEYHQEDSFTMDAVFERYRKEISDKQTINTKRQRESQLKRLKHSFGKMLPEDVTARHIYRYMDERSATAPVSANRDVSLLCSIFTKAIRWGYVSNNPARGLEKNKEQPRQRYITDTEYELIRARMPAHVVRAVELGYLTGQRIGDLLSLQWGQVQPDGIHLKQGKTGAALIIEHSQELDELLQRCKGEKVRGRTVLADAEGQAFNYWSIANPFRKTVRALTAEGLITEKLTFHDLRRKAGSDIDDDSELLGHMDPRTKRRVYQVKPRVVKPTR